MSSNIPGFNGNQNNPVAPNKKPPFPPRDNGALSGRTVQQNPSNKIPQNLPPFNPELDAELKSLMIKPSAPLLEETSTKNHTTSTKTHTIGKEINGLSSSDAQISPPSGSPPKDIKVNKVRQAETRISPVVAKLATAFNHPAEHLDTILSTVTPTLTKEITLYNNQLSISSTGLDILVDELIFALPSLNNVDLTVFGDNIPNLAKFFSNIQYTKITQVTIGRKLIENEIAALVMAIKDNSKLNVEPTYFENYYAMTPKIRDMGFAELALTYCHRAMGKFSHITEQKAKLFCQIGKANRKLGHYDLAEAALLNAYNLDNNYYNACCELYILYKEKFDALSLLGMGKEFNNEARLLVEKMEAVNEKAIQWGIRALEISDKSNIKNALWNLSLACVDDHSPKRLARLEFAAVCLKQLIEIDPTHIDAIELYTSIMNAI